METLKSQNIALDDKEARRLDRASTDGKIPRFSADDDDADDHYIYDHMMIVMTIMLIMVLMTKRLAGC